MRRALAACAAGALGASSVLGFAPFGWYPVPILALAALIAMWKAASGARAAAGLGYAFGMVFFLAGVSWIYVSLHDFGGMPTLLAGVAAVLFCAVLALFPAAAGFVFARWSGEGQWLGALLAAAAWTLTEWVRGWFLTGFPWLALGYAQAPPSPLAGFAPVTGVYGLSYLSVLLAALLGLSIRPMRVRRMIMALSVLLLGGVSGLGLLRVEWTQPATDAISVSLLQGNIEQSLKWRPERLFASLDTYLRLAAENPAQLVVLPETAIPTMLDNVPPEYVAQLKRGRNAPEGDVLLGIATRQDWQYFNSAVAWGDGAPQYYSKTHLVPFGEFTPAMFAWTLNLLHIPMSNFSRGPTVQPLLAVAGQQVAANICYEDVFGEEIIRALPAATLLVNLSNTAWFGASLAQPQHLQIARMRALETGRVMLRATNTGMTAAIDPKGELIGVLPPFTVGALKVSVRGYAGSTPYVRWGNGLILAIVVLSFVVALAGRRQGRSPVRGAGA